MEELIQADIFFFVTTVSVAINAIIFSVALIYLVLILRAVKRLTDRVEEKAEELSDDIDHLRTKTRVKADELSDDIDSLRAGVRAKAETASRITSALSVARVARRITNFFREKGGSKDESRRDDREWSEEDGWAEDDSYEGRPEDRKE